MYGRSLAVSKADTVYTIHLNPKCQHGRPWHGHIGAAFDDGQGDPGETPRAQRRKAGP